MGKFNAQLTAKTEKARIALFAAWELENTSESRHPHILEMIQNTIESIKRIEFYVNDADYCENRSPKKMRDNCDSCGEFTLVKYNPAIDCYHCKDCAES